ncbi:MAG: tRNA epoxyqueuosine(34) reductase QueG [Myxococcota bacterium]
MTRAVDRAAAGGALAQQPLEERIRALGLALGLDALGFSGPEPSARTEFLRDWIARGYAGEMDYLERRLEERVDPRRVLPGVRTLIVGALACAPGGDPVPVPERAGAGVVARYAGGDDYHDVLLDRLRALEAALPAMAGRPVRSRCYVDTGPIAEKAAAERAGLGWIAKNTCLIHPELGSHLMLGVLLCDLELAPDGVGADHCGSCRACLDACPTDAFPEPYVLDATRCLAYTTIELRGAIPEPLRAAQGDRVFGCDVCQTVCPWNRSRPRSPLADPLGLRTRLAPREVWQAPSLAWILSLDEAGFLAATRGTALRRSRRRGLVRNALIAAGNAGLPSLRPLVARHAESDDAILREHARWALARIDAITPAGA